MWRETRVSTIWRKLKIPHLVILHFSSLKLSRSRKQGLIPSLLANQSPKALTKQDAVLIPGTRLLYPPPRLNGALISESVEADPSTHYATLHWLAEAQASHREDDFQGQSTGESSSAPKEASDKRGKTQAPSTHRPAAAGGVCSPKVEWHLNWDTSGNESGNY